MDSPNVGRRVMGGMLSVKVTKLQRGSKQRSQGCEFVTFTSEKCGSLGLALLRNREVYVWMTGFGTNVCKSFHCDSTKPVLRLRDLSLL